MPRSPSASYLCCEGASKRMRLCERFFPQRPWQRNPTYRPTTHCISKTGVMEFSAFSPGNCPFLFSCEDLVSQGFEFNVGFCHVPICHLGIALRVQRKYLPAGVLAGRDSATVEQVLVTACDSVGEAITPKTHLLGPRCRTV